MPARKTRPAPETLQTMKNVSFEQTAASWLMRDGCQLFTLPPPIVDRKRLTAEEWGTDRRTR